MMHVEQKRSNMLAQANKTFLLKSLTLKQKFELPKVPVMSNKIF